MSIRARLLLITAMAIAIPFLIALARFRHDRDDAVRATTAQLGVLAEDRAKTLVERIHGTAQLHFGLARAGDLDTRDRAACSAFLSQVREAYPQYTGILTIDPDGKLFCDSLRTGRALDLSDRAYFKAAKTTQDDVALEPVFGRLTNLGVLQVAHPVRSREGELRFILLASLNLGQIAHTLDRLMPGAGVLIVDKKGTVLATSPDAGSVPAVGASLVGADLWQFVTAHAQGPATADVGAGPSAYTWALADPSLTDKAGLYVLAGIPQSRLGVVANKRLVQDMTLLALGALTLFAAIWLLAEFALRRQIARITTMAEELSLGALSARIAPPLPRGELGSLMRALNQMAEALETDRAAIAKLNARLKQSERLEAIGQLTGGVAHDFNNLLTVVMGNADLLAQECADQPAQQALAHSIVQAARRGAELTQRLLAFARKQALAPSATDINALVGAIDPMLRRTLGEDVEIKIVRASALWPAMVDPGQLENALLNLCLNARDAMPGGGVLTIETANKTLDTDDAQRNSEVVPGEYVMVSVSDSGVGIAPEHLAQVFEPFFTTKEVGKGTGLGLAMVYGFLKQSSGHVSISSEPGRGTTVTLYLPRADGLTDAAALASPAPALASPAPAKLVGGTETILVVEDDALVRAYACRELRALGYRVLDADSGPSALELLARHSDVDLLLTDVVMPGGMDGSALANEVRKVRPELGVLYTSGYAESAIVHQGRLDPGVRLLEKPYPRARLASAVRSELDRGRKS